MTEPGSGPGTEPVSGLVVERVDAESWRSYRDVRLAALIDSPRAFWATYAEAAQRVRHSSSVRSASSAYCIQKARGLSMSEASRTSR